MDEKLPSIDVNYWPQVTFLGPQDEWHKVACKYKYLYEMDIEIAYDWLHVWANANHPSFKNCIIDTSDNDLNDMNYVTITTTDPDINKVSSVLDAKDKENSEGMSNILFILQYYQNHLLSMQILIQQSKPCWK
jgi:hypothetical protein